MVSKNKDATNSHMESASKEIGANLFMTTLPTDQNNQTLTKERRQGENRKKYALGSRTMEDANMATIVSSYMR